MPRLLIADAVKHYQSRGDTAITKHFLYAGCRSGTIPHYKIGNRYIIDTEQLDQHLQAAITGSIKQAKSGAEYGKLRRIGG